MRKKISALGFMAFVSLSVFSQQQTNENNQPDSSQTIKLQEVTISSLRQDMKLKETAIPIEIVNRNQIDKLSPVTPADILSKQPGVALYRDGIWATSVNIRGLSEQRIVTLIDGNRVETATDIAAGLSMIDMNDVSRVEIIKGGASSIYGTGALGGVVNFITSSGYYADKYYFHAKSATAVQSVNNMFSQNLQFKTGASNWYLKVNGTIRKAGDTKTPDGTLDNSQFKDNNLSVSSGIKTFKNQELKLNFQQFRAADVGIPGGAAFPATSTATYPKEQRNLYSAEYSFYNIGGDFKKLTFKYFHQYILRDVEVQAAPTVLLTPHADHTTNGGLVQGNFDLGMNHHLIAGIEVWQRKLLSEREKTITIPIKDSTGTVIGKNITVRKEQPIPTSTCLSSGFFVQDDIHLIENKLNLLTGARIDFINIANEQSVDPVYIIVNGVQNNKPPKQRITFAKGTANDISWSANAGLLFKTTEHIDATLNVSHAFRSPSLEERFKYIDLGSAVHIGDPNLKPEQGWFIDLGSRYLIDNKVFAINLFANFLNNLIVESPGTMTFDRLDSVGKTTTVPAFILGNINKAVLYGFDASFKFEIISNLGLNGVFSYVRGHDTKNNTNLPQIPPFNSSIGVSYNLPNIIEFNALCNLVYKQDDIATGEKATGSYARYDFTFKTAPIKVTNVNMYIAGGIENITNRDYRNFLTTNRGVVKLEPGRNIFGRFVLEF